MSAKKPTQTWGIRLIVLILCLATHTTTNKLEAQTCDFYEGSVSFSSENGNQSPNYQTKYFLTNNEDGKIDYLSDTPSFENVAAGNYEVYAINYNKNVPIVGLKINFTKDDIKSQCTPDMSGPLALRICSKPKIVAKSNVDLDICLDVPRSVSGPVIEFEERDGDGLQLFATIGSGGDTAYDILDVDLTDFPYAQKYYAYPTLMISAASGYGNNGIAPDDAKSILKTLTLISDSSTEGIRTVSITGKDPDGNESNAAEVNFKGINCESCDNLIGLRTDVRFQESCNTTYEYCLDLHRDSMDKYEILDNGIAVSQLSTCSPDTIVYYSYISLMNEAGPFEVSNWDVGDRSFGLTFDSFDELAVYMEVWDVIGNWVNNTNAFIIEGSKIRNSYGALEITQVNTGKIWTIEPDKRIQRSQYVSIPLTVGEHELVIIDKIERCSDTLDVSILCDNAISYVPELIALFDTVQVGQTGELCLDHDGIDIVGIYNECEPSSGEYVRFGTRGTSCITFEGVEVGLDSFCVVACGPIGDCDTTTLFVNVIPTIYPPVAVDDISNTEETVPVFVDMIDNDDLRNGTLQEIFILDEPAFGSVELDVNNGHIAEYVPKDNFCGWTDSFTYVIVNEVSQDTATVVIDIACDSLRVLNGFSPNGDGVNDMFVILGIEDIEENRVRIFGRMGSRIHSKENYDNQAGWDGTWEGKDLPDGTYFYTIEDRARRIIRSGWVQLHRG